MTFDHHVKLIVTNDRFERYYLDKVRDILLLDPVDRGAAHAMKDDTTSRTHELMHVTEQIKVSSTIEEWQEVVRPNLPWAEDHFQERIGGEALNPAPSEAWWPYARQGNAEHKKGQLFSHTYPERFWPKRAGHLGQTLDFERMGIRFPYGDLSDLIEVLKKNPWTRQAYLPIWFPEDLGAAGEGERVPCSLGYHFIYNPGTNGLDCVYNMRSCDLVRFYRDDVYMAGRLLQHVASEVGQFPGKLVLNIANLHCFPGDRPLLQSMLSAEKVSQDPRSNYNFDGLL
jgi:thymidylate synthase